jgi:hypothetical protein
MAKQSSVNLDITNNADGFDISGGTTVRKLGITGGDVTIAGSGSAVVTFPTTSTTIAGLGITQSFSALQSFSAGISAAGGVTLAGTLQGTTASFTGLVSSAVGFSGAGTNLTNVAKLNTSNIFTPGSNLTLSGSGLFGSQTQITNSSILFTENYDGGTTTLTGAPQTGSANTVTLPQTTGTVALTNGTVASFNGRTGAVQGVSAAVGSTYLTVSGSTGAVTFTNTGVQTFNGLTGAVSGVTVGGTNVFTALNTFNAGISAAGGVTLSGTFSGVTGSFSRLLTASAGINTEYISTTDKQLYINDIGVSRVSMGDFSGNGNSTHIYLRDNISVLYISNPFGNVAIGDPNGIDSGNYISYSATDSTLYGNSNSINGFSDLSTNYVFASLGISAAGGATFSGTVSSDTGYRISSSAFNTQTGTTYTFIAADNGEIVTFNNGSTITVTVPTGLPIGFNCTAIELGVGQVGFTAAAGVTLNAYASGFKIAGQHGSAALISYTSNVYNLSGTLTI